MLVCCRALASFPPMTLTPASLTTGTICPKVVEGGQRTKLTAALAPFDFEVTFNDDPHSVLTSSADTTVIEGNDVTRLLLPFSTATAHVQT